MYTSTYDACTCDVFAYTHGNTCIWKTCTGGKTRKTAGPRSEGESYWLLAEAAGWYDAREVRERTFTEVCVYVQGSVYVHMF